ncbi:MAG: DEAD/DEAH box helicase [Bacteroidales bacterium]|nr:DEAD/DEAH box helicase [Bacteroidales bacterium]MCF8391380.1 DEAD/DEAH box helicase [Bacteroidales bacterium]
MSTFQDLGLNPDLLKAVEELNFITPTPIQEKVIPVLMEAKQDVIGLAQTGTGKTAAFGLPVLQQINTELNDIQSIILCPTRELCIQITKDLKSYSKYQKGISVVSVYGGASIDTQVRALKRGANIVVGTPGRTLDLINRKVLKINSIKWLILDEADEMLNMGFREDLDSILADTPKEKQVLLFSATMPAGVRHIANNYMNTPVEISAGKKNMGAANVSHHYYMVMASDRYLALKRIADINPDIYGIIFCRTRQETKDVAAKFMEDGYNADALHGDLSQSQRDYVMDRFRSGQLQLLVATDVAARGLDINNLTHVINYNLPDDPEVYIHRSGRTGRAGNSGISILIAHTRDGRRISEVERLIGKKFERKMIPSGKEICEKRLYSLMDKIENIEVDEEQIGPFLDAINKKLEWIDKEELLKRFVSVEFNRYLEYYKDAKDINVTGSDRSSSRDSYSGRRGDRNDSSSRRGSRDDFSNRRGGRDESSSRRGGRDESSDRREGRDDSNRRTGRVEAGERRGNRDESPRRERERSSNKNFSRLFINVGTKHHLKAPNLIGLVNENTRNRNIEIGKIEILRNFSFFEVESGHEQLVLDSFKNAAFGSTKLTVQSSKPASEKREAEGGETIKREKRKRKES